MTRIILDGVWVIMFVALIAIGLQRDGMNMGTQYDMENREVQPGHYEPTRTGSSQSMSGYIPEKERPVESGSKSGGWKSKMFTMRKGGNSPIGQ